MLQAISSAPPERVNLKAPQPCTASKSTTGEIVVCARRDGESAYRINLPPDRQQEIPKAEVKLGDGVRTAVETEQGDLGGVPTKRVMVRLKIKF